jgi:hypothetical protein
MSGEFVFESPIDSEMDDDGTAEKGPVDVSVIVGPRGVAMLLVVLGIMEDLASPNTPASQVRTIGVNGDSWQSPLTTFMNTRDNGFMFDEFNLLPDLPSI